MINLLNTFNKQPNELNKQLNKLNRNKHYNINKKMFNKIKMRKIRMILVISNRLRKIINLKMLIVINRLTQMKTI
jgi:hypothetical protein